MALIAQDLADSITLGLGQSLPSPDEVVGLAEGILDELKAGVATFGGVPSPHFISGVLGPSMASRVKDAAGYPSVSSELTGLCSAIAASISTAIVTYTGPTPPTVPNFFLGGTVSAIIPATLATGIAAGVGAPEVTDEIMGLAEAIADYIMANAQVVSGIIS